jgi:hypothetical protein
VAARTGRMAADMVATVSAAVLRGLAESAPNA